MADPTTVEALIERCVSAGIEARRAHARLLTLEAQHPPAAAADLAQARAEADRLSRAYLESQRPLAAAGLGQFQARLAQAQHRIAEQLR